MEPSGRNQWQPAASEMGAETAETGDSRGHGLRTSSITTAPVDHLDHLDELEALTLADAIDALALQLWTQGSCSPSRFPTRLTLTYSRAFIPILHSRGRVVR